ncbi:unnamed protein product, partial [marine sediment metagenome]
MSDKPGKPFYSLTPKAHEFLKAFEAFCAERGIKKEEIHELCTFQELARVGSWVTFTYKQSYED